MIGCYKIVGVFLADIRDEFRSHYVQKIANEAERYGYRVIVYNSFFTLANGLKHEEALWASYHLINFDILDAMIILTLSVECESVLQTVISQCRSRDIPVITMDRQSAGCYGITNRLDETFEKLVRHVLVKHQVTDVIMLSGDVGNRYARERETIFKKVLRECDIVFHEDMIVHGGFRYETAKDAVEKVMQRERKAPEAFICANDLMAIGVIDKLREYGYRIPEDVIVTGIDGSLAGRYHSPKLTTCRLMIDRDAEETVQVLADLFCGKVTERHRVIPHELVLGASCGCGKDTVSYYGDTVERIYNKYCQASAAEQNCYQLIANVLEEPSLPTFGDKVMEVLTRASMVALNADIRKRARTIEDKMQQPFAEQMYELAACNQSGTKITGSFFPRQELMPNIEYEIHNKQALIITPLCFGKNLYGYYATHQANIIDNAEELFRNVRAINIALKLVLEAQENNL